MQLSTMTSSDSGSADLLGSLDMDESKQSLAIETNGLIKLSVGGSKFITTRATLSKSGYFRAVLSGNFAAPPQDDGYLFIDRDPVIFGYLLKYMRSDYVSIPTNRLQEVNLETKYLQIDLDLSSFINMCNPKTVTICKSTTTSAVFTEINGTCVARTVSGGYENEVQNQGLGVFDDFAIGLTSNKKHRRLFASDPLRFAAFLARNGYDILSSAIGRGGSGHGNGIINTTTECLIVLRKTTPENVVITKQT